MGWRGRGGGWNKRWSSGGPFSDLPPWQRPGWQYGGGRPSNISVKDTSPNCFRFPWLPRWWWADPKYASKYPNLVSTSSQSDEDYDKKQEKEYLNEQKEWMNTQLEAIKNRLDELEKEE